MEEPLLELATKRAEAALQLIVKDIESTTTIREDAWIQQYDDWMNVGEGDAASTKTSSEGEARLLACHFGGHSFSIHADQSAPEMIESVAFQLQEDVILWIRRPWPSCSAHEHPLSTEVLDGVAVWRCPHGSGECIRIGELSGAGVAPR